MLSEIKQSKLVLTTLIVSLLIAIFLTYYSEQANYEKKRLSTKTITSSYVGLVTNNISQALSAAYPIAALIRKQQGDTSGFLGLASEMMSSYPGVASLQLQPNGIITEVVPLKGNEGAIGHNLLLDPVRNKEAFLARDTRKLTLAGPFKLVQGGIGAAARFPIFIDEKFWGFTGVLIRFPDVLESAKLPQLVNAGYAYQLSRIHPDTGAIDIISKSDASLLDDPESFDIQVPNASWQFQVSPINGWTSPRSLFLKALAGLFFTLLTSFLSILLIRLKTERQQLEQLVFNRTKELELMAHYDALTSLPNRMLFADRFKLATAHSDRTKRMLAVCFLDLDDFKVVNDSYGHDEGDNLLIEVAKRIQSSVRGEDTVSRQGGDEFALLLNDIESNTQLEQSLDRIRQAVIKPYSINGHEHKIGISIGATLYPRDNADLDTLIRHSDQAMYQAKLTGKNRYRLFDTTDDQLLVQRHSKLQEIQNALANNEFHLYYQPKVNMRTGDVFGAEALIRWIHPEQGLIPPLDFLPLIENSDLEIQIGGWVINEALSQLDQWQKRDINLEVSVNISSHHLQSASFFDQLNSALDNYPAVSSQDLQLEVLESSALGDIQAISGIIKSCQTVLGVNVALDDFGTGYSSLTHLRSLSANTIKIDQSFVRDLLDDPNDYSIIEGVISLAKAFDREVIAEGVESTDHGLMLLIMGCNEAQGYGISRPMPAEDMAAWLQNYVPNAHWQDFSSTQHSERQQKLMLLKMTTGHWFNSVTENILSEKSDDYRKHFMQCHMGAWLSRFGEIGLFNQHWLSSLKTTHDSMYAMAKSLIAKHQQADIKAAKAGLSDLNSAYQDVAKLIESGDIDP